MIKKIIIKTICVVFATFILLSCFSTKTKASTYYYLDVPDLTVLPDNWGNLKVKMIYYDEYTQNEKSIYKERFADFDMSATYEIIEGSDIIGLDTLDEGYVYGMKEGSGKVKVTVTVHEYDADADTIIPAVYEKIVNVNVKIKDFAKYCQKENCVWLEKVKNKNAVYLNVYNPTSKNMIIQPNKMIAKQHWTRTEKNSLLMDVVVEKGTNKYNTEIDKKVTIKPGQSKKIKVDVGPKNNINANYAIYLYFDCKWDNQKYRLKAVK